MLWTVLLMGDEDRKENWKPPRIQCASAARLVLVERLYKFRYRRCRPEERKSIICWRRLLAAGKGVTG